jgi:hypothetical protein
MVPGKVFVTNVRAASCFPLRAGSAFASLSTDVCVHYFARGSIVIAMAVIALLRRQSSPAPLLFWGGFGFCAGIWLFVTGFRLLQRRRLILDTPFSKIRSASMGMVEVSGLAVGPYNLVAPITARPCYYYRTLVWEWRQEGKNKQWVKVAGECMHVPFFVDDNTGRLLVDPRGADLELHCDFEQQFCDSFFTTKEPAPPNVAGFLGRHGIATNNKIKVQEYCIKPKNSLFLLGTLGENPGLEVKAEAVPEIESLGTRKPFGVSLSSHSFSFSGGSAEPSLDGSFAQRLAAMPGMPAEIIRLSPGADAGKPRYSSQQETIAAALLRAGIANPAAWSAAGLGTASGQIIPDALAAASGANGENSDPAAGNGFDAHPPVVLAKGTNNTTFLISWRSQQEVARELGWKCTLMIWGGPVLALFSLYVLLAGSHLL